MNYSIKIVKRFEKDVKKLKKKFPKIKQDLQLLVEELYNNPTLGMSLGENIYKIRIPNSSIPIGKSGGFRVITYYKINEVIYLITIYSKTHKDNILINELKEIIQQEIKK